MAVVITLEGIDNAISNLAYKNKKSLKYRVISALRAHYSEDISIEDMPPIDTDELVKELWETGEDYELIKKKRKNFNVIKSSINDDFKRLFDEGRNIEGIAIGPGNHFVMSSEAKDKVLSKVGASLSRLSQEPGIIEGINEILDTIKDMVATVDTLTAGNDFDGAPVLGKIRNMLQDLSQTLELGVDESGKGGAPGIEITDDDIVEIVEEDQSEEMEILDEAEILEDVDSLDEDDVEVVDEEEIADDLEILDEEDLPEESLFAEKDESLEEIEIADEDEIHEDVEILDEDDIEVVDEEEIADDQEILDEEDLPEESSHTGEDKSLEEVVLADEDDVEVIDEEDLPEHIEEILDEDEVLEEADVVDEEILNEEDVVDFDHHSDTLTVFGSDFLDGGSNPEDEKEKNRILHEKFEGFLSVRERFYNQYLIIPSGEYIIGSKSPAENELPQKVVGLKEFYIGKFPVTNALFEIFVEETGYKTTAEVLGYGNVYYGKVRKIIDERTGAVTLIANNGVGFKKCYGACWYQPAGPGSMLHNKRSHPVVQVSIQDAKIFSAWIGKKLPTEAQWEAAMRTAKGYPYPWGSRFNQDACNIEENHIGDTTPVDHYIKFENQLGIADGIGNVYEWTSDYDEEASDLTANSKSHIVKGGSWLSDRSVRLSMRFQMEAKTTSNILGFRCVAD